MGVNGEKGWITLSSVGRAEHSEGTLPAEDSHRALVASLRMHSWAVWAGTDLTLLWGFADDHSRILLKPENSHSNSDYINASPIVSTVPTEATSLSQGTMWANHVKLAGKTCPALLPVES